MGNECACHEYNRSIPHVKDRLDKADTKINPWILHIFILVLPFLLFHWMLPFITSMTLGRDFIRYYVWHQMEFMFALKNGTFPLYYHYVSGGLPSHVWIGYGQAFLPIPYILSLLPGYWTGKAIQWNTLSLLITIPAAHVAILRLVREFNKSDLMALLLSTVTVYTSGMLILFRYGNGLNAWVGHLLLCAAIGFYFLSTTKIKGPLTIILAAYWLVNSGHPEIMYFAMLGAGLFTILLPFFVKAILPRKTITARYLLSFWGKTGAFVAIGLVLSSAYLVPMYFDVVKTLWFSQHEYVDACLLTDTLSGFINNFISPLRSSSFAAFGGNPLLIAIILSPVLKIFHIKIPAVIWGILTVIILSCLFMLGDNTPAHFYLWKYLPFASATRIPGRISIMLPILFLLLMAWLFHIPQPIGMKTASMPASSFLALAALVLLVCFTVFIPEEIKSNLCPEARFSINGIPTWVEPLSLILTAGFLLLVAIEGVCRNIWREPIRLFLCLAACTQLVILFRFSPLPAKILNENDIRTYSRLAAEKGKTMDMFPDYLYPHDKMTRIDLLPQYQNYFVEPCLATIYRNPIVADNRDEVYNILNRNRKQNEVVVEQYPEKFPFDRLAPEYDKTPDTVRLVYSSYNRMVFEAQALLPSFFVFAYQKTGHWQAYLNGKKTPVYRANGYAQAVRIPAGGSKVEFRYWSQAALLGMLISCCTLALLGIIIGLLILRNHKGCLLTAVTVFMAAGLFFFWYRSIYTGDNLNTRYSWTSPGPDAPENIAFGKPTRMSSSSILHPYMYSSRCAVDGGRSFPSCFITDWQPVNNPELVKLVGHPWWEVDLEKSELIGLIVIYASLQGEELDRILDFFPDNTERVMYRGISTYKTIPVHYNRLPMVIALSEDRKDWRFTSINRMDKNSPLKIRLEEPVTARYVRIMAGKPCRLCLDEVEVYRFKNQSISDQ